MTRVDGERLATNVHALSRPAQQYFALLCAERLRACCWACGLKESWDVSPYLTACDRMFDQLVGNSRIRDDELALMKQQLDAAVPHSDEYGYLLAVQAQSGMIASLCALDLLSSGKAEDALGAADAVIDALNNYEYHLYKTMMGSDGANPAKDREIAWQADCVERLQSLAPGDREAAIQLRITNGSYAVPPAV